MPQMASWFRTMNNKSMMASGSNQDRPIGMKSWARGRSVRQSWERATSRNFMRVQSGQCRASSWSVFVTQICEVRARLPLIGTRLLHTICWNRCLRTNASMRFTCSLRRICIIRWQNRRFSLASLSFSKNQCARLSAKRMSLWPWRVARDCASASIIIFSFPALTRLLRRAVRSRALGPLDHVSINHFFEIGQIRLGPFDSWMLRAPENALLEIGPHLVSVLLDLVGSPDDISVAVDRKIAIPNGAHVFRRWRIQLAVGRTAVDININLGPGFAQRIISARGLLGTATADLDANTCIVDRRTPLGPDFDRYRRSASLARQLRSQARTTLADYILSRLKLRQRGNPYQVSIIDSIAAFYSGLVLVNSIAASMVILALRSSVGATK